MASSNERHSRKMAKAIRKTIKQSQPPRAPRASLDQSALTQVFDDEHGRTYRRVLEEAQARALRFALGGGFAVSAYTSFWRSTKDIDIYVLPSDRDAMIAVLTDAGLDDYYDQLPYDREWIYRGRHNGAIVDVIWEMANHHAKVDEAWLTRGPEVEVDGLRLRVLPPEELIWSKLHILQRDRCDWPDALNLIYVAGEDLDWDYLLDRVADGARLMAGVLSAFIWLCPGRARKLPPWLWPRVGLPPPPPMPTAEFDLYHVGLIDSRPWFIPALTAEPFQ